MGLIKKIERFAPQEHRTERVDYYYNYGSLSNYMVPLLDLLRMIQSKRHYKEMDLLFAEELLIRLKKFYDIKNSRSLQDILEDNRFITKYRQVFTLFYGRFSPPQTEISNWILQIREEYYGSQGL
ncbi:MAG: hypothetical protein ACK4WB_01705 [Desulfatiglandales bacterium]